MFSGIQFLGWNTRRLAVVLSALAILNPRLSVAASLAPTGLLCQLMEHPEETVITDPAPQFGWIYQPSTRDDAQTGYRIIVASGQDLADRGVGDVWDSGLVTNAASINVRYAGSPLQPGKSYFWRVQTRDGAGQLSPGSVLQEFRTANQLIEPAVLPPTAAGVIYHSTTNPWANRYPLRFVDAPPVLVTNTAAGRWFIDFGQDAFAFATLHLDGEFRGKTIQARFGERSSGPAVATHPGGTVRYATSTVALRDGDIRYEVRPPVFSGQTVDVRPEAGVVMPFRYLELIDCPGSVTASNVLQRRLEYEFNDRASTFDSSSPALNEVWALCKYSMKATSFAGVYVDGDRERKPYEADAYINQLSHYAVDREFTLARYTQEYLLAHPTWPTEWKFHSILLAWADYLQTGNTELLFAHYDTLVTKLFLDRARSDGLIRGFPDAPQSSGNSDIVDWPEGERDGYVMRGNHYSSVINAFYYRCLRIMTRVAALVGRTNDAADFHARADQVYQSYNAVFWNETTHAYVDGEGITHSSAHANFFPLAFGLVPAANTAAVLEFLHTRGMAPSVYGAQFLLDGLFDSGDADYALGLMTTNGPRSWLNMIRIGSTITTEAWDSRYKPNMDWNHAWGAAAGNILTRYVLGLRPLEAGFGRVLIQPQLGRSLEWAEGTIPTIRGPVFIHAENPANGFRLRLNLPGNVAATVKLPAKDLSSPAAMLDGRIVAGSVTNGWLTLPNVGAGQHVISLTATNRSPPPGRH